MNRYSSLRRMIRFVQRQDSRIDITEKNPIILEKIIGLSKDYGITYRVLWTRTISRRRHGNCYISFTVKRLRFYKKRPTPEQLYVVLDKIICRDISRDIIMKYLLSK